MGLNYYEDYCVDTYETLISKLNSQDYLNQDVRLMGDFKSLGKVKKIYGHFNLDNDNLNDIGDLSYVKTNVWIHSGNSQLKSLSKLERVGGDLEINGSNITDLGYLKRVGGRVNIRDTNILDLGRLKFIGGDLFLPKRLKSLSLDGIEIKGKVRYWNDKKDSKVERLNLEHSLDELYFSDIHNQEFEKKKRILDGEFLVNRCFQISEYNNYIIDNFNDFISFVDLELEKLYGENYSFYKSFYGELKSTKEINNELPKIKIDNRFNYRTHSKKRKLSNKIISEEKDKYPFSKYFNKLKIFKNNDDWNKGISSYWLSYNEHKLGFGKYSGDTENSFIYFIENKLLETFSVFVDSLQNKFRVSKGLPKIGEGWISETELFYKIKEHFSSVEVIQHGKTKWLGKQHIDIWIPKYRVGIEYQGEQHQKPIDFFGGEKGYIKNKERDDRKKKLFKLNNSYLIEVFPNYNLNEVFSEIEGYIKSYKK